MVMGVTAFALVQAACSNGSSGSTANGNAAAGDGQQGGQTDDVQTVSVSKGDLGQMLVDSHRRTLYVFLSDTSSKSTCYQDCADNWPALTTSGTPGAGAGVDASMLGTTRRTDGSTQATFDGHPLYVFSGDSAPGDANGEGIGNAWYVVAPDGTPIKKAGGGYNGRY